MLKRKIMISVVIFCFLLLLAAYGDGVQSKEWLKQFEVKHENKGFASYKIQNGNDSFNRSSHFNPREYVRIIKNMDPERRQ